MHPSLCALQGEQPARSPSAGPCHLAPRVRQLCAAGALAAALAAQDIGFEGPRFTGAGATPTESKPESKLWHHDHTWFGVLWSVAGQSFRIHRLDFAAHAWIDTGVAVDPRPNSHCDAKWDGAHLYIASHQFVSNGSSSGNPIRLYRYRYSAPTATFLPDSGFPVTIGDYSTEALVIDEDSTGTLWAAWTQSQRIRITHSLASDTQWAAPFVLPANTTSLNADDICSLIAFGGDKVGVFWSDQNVGAYRFSYHVDGAPDNVWSAVEDATTGETDDHLNVKTDSTGRVFVAGKNDANNLLLLVRSAGGSWSRHVIYPTSPIRTRPNLLLDEEARTIHVFSTGQDSGEVFEKVSSLDSISFPGTETIRMRDASNVFRISNPTSSKQTVDSATGLAVLAHHDTTGSYWHHEVAPALPVASYTVFGAGCSGALGVPGNTASALPIVGQTFQADFTNLPQDGMFFLLGFNDTTTSAGPLPLDLGPYGAPGCLLRINPFVDFVIVGSSHTASYTLAIPNELRHYGAVFYTQCLAFDPAANVLGLVASDAARAVIGTAP